MSLPSIESGASYDGDPLGRLVAVHAFGTRDTVSTVWTASALGELSGAVTRVAGAPAYELFICARDEHGRITRRSERWRSGGRTRLRRYAYAYDARGFLSAAIAEDGVGVPCNVSEGELLGRPRRPERWTYDAAGNRDDLVVNDEDQATVGGRQYDLLGHLSRHGDRTFSYDAFGHLRASSRRTGPPSPPRRPPGRPPVPLPTIESGASYDWDPLGRLVAVHPFGTSDTPEQRFIYRDALNPIAWQRPSISHDCAEPGAPDTLFFVYASLPDTPDLAYVDECSDGTIDATWRYVTDERGSVRLVLDVATGEVVQEIAYDAWGLPDFEARGEWARAPEAVQPFGYIGGIYDAETGFWHLGARDYDPTIGRWTTKDPIGFAGGMSLYGYTLNEPMNRVDPRGLSDSWTYDLWSAAWSLPSNLVGLTLGMLGSGTDIGFDAEHNATEFYNNALIDAVNPGGATTFGHVICYASVPDASQRAHEYAHVGQSDVLGPLYLALHAIAGVASIGLHETPVPPLVPSHSYSAWHSHNPLEYGPSSTPPAPWY